MKNKQISKLLLLSLAFSACTYEKYLPKSDVIDINQYGSYIDISLIQGKDIAGELIAVDSNSITVLSNDSSFNIAKVIPLNQVRSYSVQYATPKNYGWTIPVFSLATIAHGYFLVFTLPVNLITTISVNSGAIKSLKYNNKKITYDQLKMFARFPQGIPASIDITSIR